MNSSTVLFKTLNKIFPVEYIEEFYDWNSQIEIPSLCFQLFRPDVETFNELLSSLEVFCEDSNLKVFSFKRRICLGLKKERKYHYSSKAGSSSLNLLDDEIRLRDYKQKSFSLEVINLCNFLENKLNLTNKTQKIFSERMLEDAVNNRNNHELLDFVELGMHQVKIVENVDKPTADVFSEPKNLILSFGLSYEEWLTILIEVFQIDKGFDEKKKQELKEKKIILNLSEELIDFPLFSRIKGSVGDVEFKNNEIEMFKGECLLLMNKSKSIKARRGIDKLLKICDWAQSYSFGIYLVGV